MPKCIYIFNIEFRIQILKICIKINMYTVPREKFIIIALLKNHIEKTLGQTHLLFVEKPLLLPSDYDFVFRSVYN